MVVEHRNYLGCCRSCHFLGCLLHTTTSLPSLDDNRKKLPLSVFRYYNGFDYPAYVSLALYPHGYSGQSEPTPMTCWHQFILSIGSFVSQPWLTAYCLLHEITIGPRRTIQFTYCLTKNINCELEFFLVKSSCSPTLFSLNRKRNCQRRWRFSKLHVKAIHYNANFYPPNHWADAIPTMSEDVSPCYT